MRILGIESSCDETGASVVADGRDVLSNVIATQDDLHVEYAGVVPEIASRAHVERFASSSAIRMYTSKSGGRPISSAVDGVRDDLPRLIDVQWKTDHLETLGVRDISRVEYRRRLRIVLDTPDAAIFRDKTPRIDVRSA